MSVLLFFAELCIGLHFISPAAELARAVNTIFPPSKNKQISSY